MVFFAYPIVAQVTPENQSPALEVGPVNAAVSVSLCVFISLLSQGRADAQVTTRFRHVVIVVQENRTPDNLFHSLLTFPGVNPARYNIASTGLALVSGKERTIQLSPVPLTIDYDPNHNHPAFLSMYDKGKMDGANLIPDNCAAASTLCKNDGAGQFLSYKYVDNTTHIIDPYLELAADYGWANLMFQTNQGPSYPAHQFLFGGTSALSAGNDAKGTFIAENPGNSSGANYAAGNDTGCLSPIWEWNFVVSAGSTTEPKLKNILGTFCATRNTLPTLLDASRLTWKYYAPAMLENPFPNDPTLKGYNPGGSIWNAPASIKPICQPNATFEECTGHEYADNVDLKPADVLTDITGCKLAAVSWVIPAGQNSDHPMLANGGGPSWVASIVNAIGENTTCDKNGYWKDTAIVVTWDDWGGWYDHVAPQILPGAEGDYQLGFRVPLLFVSAYTPTGTVSNVRDDFGSILRFVEGNFNLRQGGLGFADARATTDLREFYDFLLGPLPFRKIAAPLKAADFINDNSAPTPPDED
jgi:phospholipase C